MPGTWRTRQKTLTGVRGVGSRNQGPVHEARRSDLAELVALDRACFGRLAWPTHGWWQVIVQPGWRARLLRESGVLVAASVLLSDRPVMVLASLGVHPSCRRRGLGRTLLLDAVAEATSAGAQWLSLEVDRDNREAINLYRRTGFAPLRRFVEDGRQRIEMVRRVRGRAQLPAGVVDERLRGNRARIVRR